MKVGTDVVAIRLKPSVTSYKAFVLKTAKALNDHGPASSKAKPNKLVLSLTNLGV